MVDLKEIARYMRMGRNVPDGALAARVSELREEALKIVRVSKMIEEALTKGEGEFGKILKFMRAYEDANWSEVSRVMVLENVDMDETYRAYLDALKWYKTIYAS